VGYWKDRSINSIPFVWHTENAKNGWGGTVLNNHAMPDDCGSEPLAASKDTTMLYWVLGITAGVTILLYINVRLNRRTCMLAFGKGVQDASSLPWRDLLDQYRKYLRPIRPMDAAAYQRGVEYCLLRQEGESWENMKRYFNESWNTGMLTREGANIRKLGADSAEKNFRLRIPEELERRILQNPRLPPLQVEVQHEEEGT
jgi:hypothetical protein